MKVVRNAAEPRVVELAPQRVAVTRSEGDPRIVGGPAIAALYGAVYRLKVGPKRQGIDLRVGHLRARWPKVEGQPRERWVGLWALPVPEGTVELLRAGTG